MKQGNRAGRKRERGIPRWSDLLNNQRMVGDRKLVDDNLGRSPSGDGSGNGLDDNAGGVNTQVERVAPVISENEARNVPPDSP